MYGLVEADHRAIQLLIAQRISRDIPDVSNAGARNQLPSPRPRVHRPDPDLTVIGSEDLHAGIGLVWHLQDEVQDLIFGCGRINLERSRLCCGAWGVTGLQAARLLLSREQEVGTIASCDDACPAPVDDRALGRAAVLEANGADHALGSGAQLDGLLAQGGLIWASGDEGEFCGRKARQHQPGDVPDGVVSRTKDGQKGRCRRLARVYRDVDGNGGVEQPVWLRLVIVARLGQRSGLTDER